MDQPPTMQESHAEGGADSPQIAQPKPRKRGRPRKKPTDPDPKRDLIVEQAKRLWHSQGYQATTIAQIAKASGLNAASLYYYFPSKEAILSRLCRFDRSLTAIPLIATADETAVVRLTALTVYDMYCKCMLPFDFYEFEGVLKRDPDRFNAFLDVYASLFHSMVAVLREGVENGEFTSGDDEERVVTIFSINEGLQHHYHAKLRGEMLLSHIGYEPRGLEPFEIGALSVQAVLPSLMKGTIDLNQLKDRVQRVLKSIPGQTGVHAEKAEATVQPIRPPESSKSQLENTLPVN